MRFGENGIIFSAGDMQIIRTCPHCFSHPMRIVRTVGGLVQEHRCANCGRELELARTFVKASCPVMRMWGLFAEHFAEEENRITEVQYQAPPTRWQRFRGWLGELCGEAKT